jgi:formylglycine-generating enzyme required for sulfatase activity
VEAYIEEKKHEAESMLLRQQQEPRRQLEKHTQREAHARGRQQGRTRTIIYALGAILALGLIAVLVFSAAQIIQVRQSYTRATATVEQQYTNATVTLEPQQASATATIEAILASGGRVDEQGKVMVYVPAGEFQMGDEEFAKPVHTVILDAFWIDRTEVTNAQYQECVDAGVCDPPEHHVFIFEITPDLAGELDQNIIPDNLREKFEEHNRTLTPHARMKAQKSASNFIIVDFNREYIIKRETWLREPMIGVYVLVEEDCINSPNYSVVGVDWYDANTYCEWADKQLPTEAQWEYAARGPESFIYPWGNEWREKAASCQDGEMRRHTCNDGYEHIAPVGSLPEGASWVGALDMSGNVEEWVFDWLDDYSPETQINPTGPVTGTVKITRGGSYQRGGLMLNAVDRRPTLPENSSLVSGFRCAAPASEP